MSIARLSFHSFFSEDKVAIDEIIGYSIESQTRKRVYLQLASDVASMGDDCMHRDEQSIGNLLIAHTHDKADDDLFLAF